MEKAKIVEFLPYLDIYIILGGGGQKIFALPPKKYPGFVPPPDLNPPSPARPHPSLMSNMAYGEGAEKI